MQLESAYRLLQAEEKQQQRNTSLLLQKVSCPFIKARRAEEKPARRHCGATLPPAGHRNRNAASPEEKSSLLLGFRAEDWTAGLRKLRETPVRTRERKGISRRGPATPPLDCEPSAEP
ncbi:unnamed protein product [Rangifer tarandus platyrhynchus]|uniref:Uncharacterized protein n=1 Tax=Rangifer tarandus platyrhynchus TaxID=3082113 RepID=A0ABN9A971_RANTA|nr:unnamed protein product [Rangifer tarandus platyrhynchus]